MGRFDELLDRGMIPDARTRPPQLHVRRGDDQLGAGNPLARLPYT